MILFRSVLFNVYFFSLTLILCIVGSVWRHIAPSRTILVPRLWARLVVSGVQTICGIRLEVSGQEYLPPGSALIASRHQSAFDTMVWLTLLPNCMYVLKKELTRIPLFGGMVRPSGMIVVDRQAGAGAIRHLMKEADRAKAEGRPVIIFPEGTRADPDNPLPLQPGIAAMALHAGLPVVPVLTDSGRCWGRRSFMKRPGIIHIAIRSPLSPEIGRQAIMRHLDEAFHEQMPQWSVDNSVGCAVCSLSVGSKLAR